MEERTLSEFYSDKNTVSVSVNKLKFWLMPFVYFALLGFPTRYGSYVTFFSNFAAPAFFILCGFFNLTPDKETRMIKIKKAMKRSFIFFGILFLSFVTLNIIYLAYYDLLNISVFSEIFRKRTIFNFFVLNMWIPLPMGGSIWFIHSLFYAYVFFFIAEKINLSKFYIPILIILFVTTLATGEFAAFLKFPHFEYNYIPAGALTRAVPYMIIGMVIRRHIDVIGKIKRYLFAVFFFCGLAFAFAEVMILRYLGKFVSCAHTIGIGIMAISICCFALVYPVVSDRNFYSNHGRKYAKRLYAFCQPMALMLYIIGPFIYPPFILYFYQYSSLLALVISFLISLTIGIIKHTIIVKEG